MPIGISKSRWQEIQSALDEVLDKPEDERLKFLDKFAKDEQLYVELKKLIGHDLNRVSILDSPAAELLQMGELSASERDDPTPHSLHINNNTNNNKFPTIEKYQIEKEVGRGGMGRVYLARQVNDSFERRVAIKVLSTRNNDPQIIQRFEKEQRLLASLEHQLSHGKTVPLVVDDCLVQLDDRRSLAALRAFSDLSEKTQVILFTHHEHLRQLANEHLAEGEYHLHELAS